MAVECVDYNCQDNSLGTFHENDCGVEFLGNHNQAIIFGCSATSLDTDFTNANTILADIAAGLAWKITGAKFSINEPTFTESEPIVPCKPKTVDFFDQDMDYENPNVNEQNDAVHATLFSGKSFAAILLNECSSDQDGYLRVKLIEAENKWKGGLVSQTGEKQRYKGKVSWRNVQVTTIAKAPGIFD